VAYYQSSRGELDVNRVDELVAQFDALESEMSIVSNLELWLLARCYCNLGQQEKANNLQKKIKKQIEIDSKSCSNLDDQRSNQSNGLHQQIMAPITPTQNNSKEAEKQACKSCGFELPDNFKFCPGCGSKI